MGLYILFALTTAIAGTILLMYPTLNRLEQEQPLNVLVQSRWLTYLVFMCIGTLIAPLLFVACIIPKSSQVFQDTLFNSIKD